jgi:hypothetical protein
MLESKALSGNIRLTRKYLQLNKRSSLFCNNASDEDIFYVNEFLTKNTPMTWVKISKPLTTKRYVGWYREVLLKGKAQYS